ncbi:MAG: DUF72 domain-containing protein [Gaiellaceae bacterium]
MSNTPTSVEGLHVGTSGWAYPSWKAGFYPAGLDSRDLLPFYAERFDTVELNTTGYRLPAEEQFRRWGQAVPDGFRFAPKLPGHRPQIAAEFGARVQQLGDRLGPVRVALTSARDEGMLTLLVGSLDPSLRIAFDLQHPSWAGVEPMLAEAGSVRVDDLDHPSPFRYLRFRDPPYDDAALAELAARVRGPLGRGETVFCYFRHEDEPTAPAYAERLLELVGRNPGTPRGTPAR